MPIVDLMPETARTYYNLLIKTYVMKFDILMWTEDTRIAVFNHLKAEGWTGQGGEGKEKLSSLIISESFVLFGPFRPDDE